MTVKTTLSFTERHYEFLKRKVEEGVYATASAGVAAVIELMMAEAKTQKMARLAFRKEIARRLQTSSSEYVPRLCCTNPVRGSCCESSVVAGCYEQTDTPRLEDQELARL